MTPRDLYAMTPIRSVKDPSYLQGCYYNHLEEAGDVNNLPGPPDDYLVEVQYIKNHCFDGRRTWTLATVWFKDKPVMVIQNAGREGDDHYERFITDAVLFKEMVDHIKSLKEQDEPLMGVVDLDQDNPALTSFYGYDLASVSEVYDY